MISRAGAGPADAGAETAAGARAAVGPPSPADPGASPAGQYVTPPATPVTVSNTTHAPQRRATRPDTPPV
ncbi:hypothetical protein; putative signal peptide [Frankia alni ACN14a]|uniref:Uncharacterized protein n=1 Tax=Frankia alni (strain DSM 45986 / CECT 9034 / ACN14a) TaxID=326424 RepID=Q0RCP6_FRAAA|nr:hypothetical protein; putative signal peptide [Frankia alni ACN14a]